MNNQTSSERTKSVLITGANRGLGFALARKLREAGVTPLLACRDADAGVAAARSLNLDPEEVCIPLDLADLNSIVDTRDYIVERFSHLDGLVNNAGVFLPQRASTQQGLDLQFGVNHIGHFALTAALLPHLARAQRARIVTVTSIAYYLAAKRKSDWSGAAHPCQPSFQARSLAYANSKLANLLFAHTLDRKLRAELPHVTSVACHPGYAATGLQQHLPLLRLGTTLWPRPPERAVQTLIAATIAPAAQFAYWAPSAPGQLFGRPSDLTHRLAPLDHHRPEELWRLSETLSGMKMF